VKRLAFPFLTVLIAGRSANAATPDTQGAFWPEVDAYVGLNSTTRLFLLSSFRNNQPGDTWHGDFGAHLNFALKPVFRCELRQKDDVFNQRILSFQAGFRYISSLASGVPYLEHRWIVDCTPRYPLPGSFIISDRNRGEMRFISGRPFSTRYRNQLQLERDFDPRPCCIYTLHQWRGFLRYALRCLDSRPVFGRSTGTRRSTCDLGLVLPSPEPEPVHSCASECVRPAVAALFLMLRLSCRSNYAGTSAPVSTLSCQAALTTRSTSSGRKGLDNNWYPPKVRTSARRFASAVADITMTEGGSVIAAM
jgi:hypothetical protein